MIRNIIWDVDGTLFDTYPPIARAFQNTIEYFGKDTSIEWIEELSKISLRHCVSTLSTEYQLEKEAIDEREFKRYYEEISAQESPPFSRVVEICDYIYSINGKNVIVTHKRKRKHDRTAVHPPSD